MTTMLRTAIARSSNAPTRNPASNLRWVVALMRAMASTAGRNQRANEGSCGSSGRPSWEELSRWWKGVAKPQILPRRPAKVGVVHVAANRGSPWHRHTAVAGDDDREVLRLDE